MFLAKLEFVSDAVLSDLLFGPKLLFFGQPSDYPLSPFKMKFDPPLLHPNGWWDNKVVGLDLLRVFYSVRRWKRVHLDIAFAWRRP